MMKRIFFAVVCIILFAVCIIPVVGAEETSQSSEQTSASQSSNYEDLFIASNSNSESESGEGLLIAPNPNAGSTTTENNPNQGRNIYNPISLAVTAIIVAAVAYMVIRYTGKKN